MTYADVAAGRKTEQSGGGGGNQANIGRQPAGGAGEYSQKMVGIESKLGFNFNVLFFCSFHLETCLLHALSTTLCIRMVVHLELATLVARENWEDPLPLQ